MNKRYFCGNGRHALGKMPLRASAYFATFVMLCRNADRFLFSRVGHKRALKSGDSVFGMIKTQAS
jgi:hypothetical protein